MVVSVDIDIKKARKVLMVASGLTERVMKMTDEEVKDRLLQYCESWAISEVKVDNNDKDIELFDIVSCATEKLEESTKKKDKELTAKYWEYYNKHAGLKDKVKAEIDKYSQYEEIWDGHTIPESNVSESFETYIITTDRAKSIIDNLL